MIKTLRENKNLTQKKLAEIMKCSIQQIQKIEQHPDKILNCATGFTYNLWCHLIINGASNEKIEMSLKEFIIESCVAKNSKYIIEDKKLKRIYYA